MLGRGRRSARVAISCFRARAEPRQFADAAAARRAGEVLEAADPERLCTGPAPRLGPSPSMRVNLDQWRRHFFATCSSSGSRPVCTTVAIFPQDSAPMPGSHPPDRRLHEQFREAAGMTWMKRAALR